MEPYGKLGKLHCWKGDILPKVTTLICKHIVDTLQLLTEELSKVREVVKQNRNDIRTTERQLKENRARAEDVRYVSQKTLSSE